MNTFRRAMRRPRQRLLVCRAPQRQLQSTGIIVCFGIFRDFKPEHFLVL
jgi:hypothetical protein